MNQSFEVCDIESLNVRFSRLQSRFPKGITNYFRQNLSATAFRVYEAEQTLAFLFDDENFERLCFFAASTTELKGWLADYRSDRPTVLAWLERVESKEFRACLEGTGFDFYDQYRRMDCRPLPVFELTNEPEFASESELVELRQRMSSDFDPVTNHFPTLSELREFAAKKWIIVRRHKGQITGYIVFQPHGSHTFFNYLFNDSSFPQDLFILFQQFFGILSRIGVTSGHLWVKHDNGRVIPLYKAYGWAFDGLASNYFVKSPNKL